MHGELGHGEHDDGAEAAEADDGAGLHVASRSRTPKADGGRRRRRRGSKKEAEAEAEAEVEAGGRTADDCNVDVKEEAFKVVDQTAVSRVGYVKSVDCNL